MTSKLGISSTATLPCLPNHATTYDGIEFDPSADIWPLNGLTKKLRLRFDEFEFLSNAIIQRLKWAILLKLQNKSFSHARNLHYHFEAFYRATFRRYVSLCDRIELQHILSYRSVLDVDTEWKLGVLRLLLLDMDAAGFGISSGEVIEYLSSSTIRGNIKGTSIRTRDSDSGAFTDNELLSIQASLNSAFAAGEISLNEFALAWLFLAYGPRPIQIAAMKEDDLIVSEGGDGKLYALRIPRAKQRSSSIRGSFNTRYCSKQVGELLERLIEANRARRAVSGLEGENWPMFMSEHEGDLPELRYHESSARLGYILERTVRRVTDLKAHARRFRITLAQRAVDDGKDKYTIAELLDHSDTQNVGVYFEASPAMVMRLDRHLAMEMAPLAQAFAGVVIATESEGRRGEDRSSRIYDRSLTNNVGEALGSCGQMSFCGLAAPFACYTCRHFQPWVDGPHEEFMAAMLADRERMETDGYSAKIYTIRDRTILAVAEVIQLCSAEIELRGEGAA